jgi:hypothetical protein
MGALLVAGGALMGVLASDLTSDSLVWHRPPPRIPTTEAPVAAAVDQASAGQGWARTAYDGGLRECPKMNPEFLAACETEMKKLAARPDFAPGSYGGPLLITKVETDDRAWEAQDRLEIPRPTVDRTDYEPLPDIAPERPAFERTPDNYPAEPAEDVAIADPSAPSIPR